jgi:hypothetical protein
MKTSILALLVGLSVTAVASQALAQSIPGPDPGGPAPGVSTTGGRPLPVNPAEVKRDNTADPNSAPGASPTGGRPVPVDPAEVRRDNTNDPNATPTRR